MMPLSPPQRSALFVPGLDSVCFLAAFWVACGHGAVPKFKVIVPGVTVASTRSLNLKRRHA
jgi:hypothetical protein